MKKILSGIFSALFFSMTFLSCGLDTFYVIPQPFQTGTIFLVGNDDPANNHVSFRTNETGMSSDFSFDGTYVYYKIFSTQDTCSTSYNSIDAVNNDSNYEKASSMITSSYKKLKKTDSTGKITDFLISGTGTNKTVMIQLTNYYSPDNVISGNESYIKIDNVSIYEPVRCINEITKKTFNFGWYNKSDYTETCALPESGDEDFNGGSLPDGDSFYYIDLYAIGAGHDTTFKSYYSRPLHLGVIKVKPSASNNWNL